MKIIKKTINKMEIIFLGNGNIPIICILRSLNYIILAVMLNVTDSEQDFC